MFIVKTISTLIFLLLSIITNYLLIYRTKNYKKNKSKICDKKIRNRNISISLQPSNFRRGISSFAVCILIIITLNIIFLLIDNFIYKNEVVDFIAFNMLLSFMLSITFEDIKTNLMDTRIIVGYFILFLIYRIIFLNLTIFLEGFIGFALSLIIMLIAYFVKRNSIGIGDIEVIAACGMIIGFPNIFHFLFKTFLFVFIYGCYLYIKKKFGKNNYRKKNKKEKNIINDEIPLAPFLLIATII